jgi:hypothetical protein
MELLDQHPKPLVTLGHPVEPAEVDSEPEGALEDSAGFDDCVVAERGGGASKLHCQHRRRRAFLLVDADLDRPLTHNRVRR